MKRIFLLACLLLAACTQNIGGSAIQTPYFAVNPDTGPVDTIPVFDPRDPILAEDGEFLHFTVRAKDADKDDLTIESVLPTGASGYIVDSIPGRIIYGINWTPTNQTGNHTLPFTVSDGSNEVTQDVLVIVTP